MGFNRISIGFNKIFRHLRRRHAVSKILLNPIEILQILIQKTTNPTNPDSAKTKSHTPISHFSYAAQKTWISVASHPHHPRWLSNHKRTQGKDKNRPPRLLRASQ